MILTYANITSQQKNKITISLALPLTDNLGLPVTWLSKNKDVITNSGRVIRPRFDQPAQTAILIASFVNGKTKEFKFTVLPDDEYKDPQYMADEDFFGKWGNNNWEVEGKFNYSILGLNSIEMAVKTGCYKSAKVELLKYMRNRKEKSLFKPTKRDSFWSNISIANIFATQENKYYQGEAIANSLEYEKIFIDVKPINIVKGGSTTYSIIAKYNENSEALIASKQHLNKDLNPKIELVVNGKTCTYDVDADATVRAGAYRNTNYGMEENLKVKMFGEFLGDETYKALIRFNFSDLVDSDVVSSARLILNVRISPVFAETKDLVVLLEATNIWEEDKVVLDTLIGYVYNFNGLPGGNHWNANPRSDFSYVNQAARFYEAPVVAEEYLITKDEKYAYHIISTMMDFIKDKGMLMEYPGNFGAWPADLPLRGGYPGVLHSSIRLNRWNITFFKIVNSKYMTPEACIAILKAIWDQSDNLQYTLTTNNARQTAMIHMLTSALNFTEFNNSDKLIKYAQQEIEAYMYFNNFLDGAYKESTSGYTRRVFMTFVVFKELMESNGRSVTREFDEMLHKSAYYNALICGPNGEHLQYGDQGAGKSTEEKYSKVVKWYNDTQLEYIDTFGRKGTKPPWTSIHFPISTVTLMRSDWSERALFAFTKVRGGGVHGHFDDNTMTVIAYDRTLLSDAGIFTYTEEDPYRIWGKSTRAHNTVEINNTSQVQTARPGNVHKWVTTEKYDFLSQSTNTYEQFDHQRTITFVKPYFWIVSDLITPNDMQSTNSYKQIWHMLPSSNLAIDDNSKSIYSNFKTGANIIIASPDKQITLTEEDGWYDFNYQQLSPSKFAYYELNDYIGKASYDTILFPYENKGSINVDRVDIGLESTIATSMKFKTVVDQQENMNYYLLDYEHDFANARTFDKYKTNNKLTFVREDKNGKWKEIILIGGSFLANADGSPVVDIGYQIKDMSFEIKGSSLIIITSQENADFSKVVLTTTEIIKSVTANGVALEFTKDTDKIIITKCNAKNEKVPISFD